MGTQYASIIYAHDEVQMEIAKTIKQELQNVLAHPSSRRLFQYKQVTTDIVPATAFYAAQEFHQEYLDRNPGGYCNHYMRNIDWSLGTTNA